MLARLRSSDERTESAPSAVEVHVLRDRRLAADELSDTEALQCTGVAWNATGSQVAASFGRLDTFGWCDYRGGVYVWNLSGRGFDPERADTELGTSGGAMCVACHPSRPAVVASGTFNGEVVLWDTSNADEPLVGVSPIEAR